MNKVILILSDGLRYDTAVEQMGFLGHLAEVKLASLYGCNPLAKKADRLLEACQTTQNKPGTHRKTFPENII